MQQDVWNSRVIVSFVPFRGFRSFRKQQLPFCSGRVDPAHAGTAAPMIVPVGRHGEWARASSAAAAVRRIVGSQGIALRNHVVLHEPTRGEVRQRSFNVHFGPVQHNRTITQRTEIRCSME